MYIESTHIPISFDIVRILLKTTYNVLIERAYTKNYRDSYLLTILFYRYLPPYTAFLPIKYEEEPPQICEKKKKRRGKVVKNLILSDLSYLAIFTIMICITERDKMSEDPLNFSVINIIVEVTR